MSNLHIDQENRVASTGTATSADRYSEAQDLATRNSACSGYRRWIVNLTNEDIIQKDRHGFTVTLEPCNLQSRRPSARELIIFEQYAFGGQAHPSLDAMTTLQSKSETTLSPNEVLRNGVEAIITKRNDRNYQLRNTSEDYVNIKSVFNKKDLQDGIYIPGVDLVFYLATSKHIYHHPDSEEGRIIRDRARLGNYSGFNFEITIHDNTSEISERWINLNGFVTKIPIIRNGVSPNHIKVIYTGDDGSCTSRILTIEEGTKDLRLYSSKEEATKYGDLKEDEKAKREREAMEQAELIEKLKLANQKTNAENKHTEHMYDKEKKERDHQDYKEKSDMEREAQRRKNMHEILKIIPAIITATVSIILFIRKF